MARAASRPGTAAYVLHSHDWSESSLILELFTRDHGRVVAVAKGAKRPYSQLRPVLMPFQRLVVTFGVKRSEDAEVWLLRQAEWAGGPAWPGGAALLPGFYLNELLMRLMVRHDPHPALFDAYGQALQAMADPTLLQAALRAFELILLRQLGHLPDLSAQTVNGQDKFLFALPLIGSESLDAQCVDGIGGNVLHQGGIDGLLLLDPAHAVKQRTDHNHLEVTAIITLGVDLIQRQGGPQDTLNLSWLHLFSSRKMKWPPVQTDHQPHTG